MNAKEDSTQITREQMLGYAALGQIMSFHVNHQTGLFDLILHNGTRHQLIASPEDYALMSRLIRMSKIKPESLQKIIKRLKDISKGKHVWRVQNKTSKAYCIEFEDYEEHDAKQWWKSQSSAYPETHKESELARVHVLSRADKLIRSAVVMLKRLE